MVKQDSLIQSLGQDLAYKPRHDYKDTILLKKTKRRFCKPIGTSLSLLTKSRLVHNSWPDCSVGNFPLSWIMILATNCNVSGELEETVFSMLSSKI
jgi:hypothetical protein